LGDFHKSKPFVVLSTGMFFAARKARRLAFEGTDPGQFGAACRALVKVGTPDGTFGEREVMAPAFIQKAKVDAGLSPLRPMGGDAPAAHPRMGDQMRQFMAQRPVHLFAAKTDEARIERHQNPRGIRHASRTPHPAVPSDLKFLRENRAADFSQELTRLGLQCSRFKLRRKTLGL
jgi:hypothetical protein